MVTPAAGETAEFFRDYELTDFGESQDKGSQEVDIRETVEGDDNTVTVFGQTFDPPNQSTDEPDPTTDSGTTGVSGLLVAAVVAVGAVALGVLS